jgi:hypothetical protein
MIRDDRDGARSEPIKVLDDQGNKLDKQANVRP